MATSGSTNFTLNRNEIIEEAFQRMGIIGEGESPTANQYSRGITTLNLMMKSWARKKIFIHKREWVVQEVDTEISITGTDSKVYRCIKKHVSAANNKPITGANYQTFWYPDTSLSGGVWATSTTYSALNNFALDDTDILNIEKAYIQDGTNVYPLEISDVDYYMSIRSKETQATPGLIAIEKKLAAPEIYLYPYPDVSTYSLNLYVEKRLEDFDAAGNTADIEQEDLETIVTNLAYKLTFKYPIPVSDRRELEKEAARTFKDTLGARIIAPTFVKSAF